MIGVQLPKLIAIAGKKLAGKDTVCDALVALGYQKVHIAEPWLRTQCKAMGVSYEDEYLPNKGWYREEIQRRATAARAADPECLVRLLPEQIASVGANRVVVSGIRFINEALWFIGQGAFVIKVETPATIRLQRMCEAGDALFDDPFEAEIDRLPHDLQLPGTLDQATIVETVIAVYSFRRYHYTVIV